MKISHVLTLISIAMTMAFSGNAAAVVSNVSSLSVAQLPEPENNALILTGLGIIALIARRKFA